MTQGQVRSEIQASELRELILKEGDARAGPLRDLKVAGALDLAGMQFDRWLRFDNCEFTGPVDLTGSRATLGIEFTDCDLNGLQARNVCVPEDIALESVRNHSGIVCLIGARVDGDLRCTGSEFGGDPDVAFNGRGMHVAGSLLFDGLTADGEVLLARARIGGTLTLRGATCRLPGGRSIDASHLVVDGELLCGDGFRSVGEFRLRWAKVGALHARGGTLENPDGTALMAESLEAAVGLFFDNPFTAKGTVVLSNARVAGEVRCSGGNFESGPGQLAIDARVMHATTVRMNYGFRSSGKVILDSAKIADKLSCTDGTFRNVDDIALSANGISCQDVRLGHGFTAYGEVQLQGARIESELNCSGATIHAKGRTALCANGMVCGGRVFLDDGFHAEGSVYLLRAFIAGELNCTNGRFEMPGGIALSANGLVCDGAVFCNDKFRAYGEVEFLNAYIKTELNCSNGKFRNQGEDALNASGLMCSGSVLLNGTFLAEGAVDLTEATVGARLDCGNGTFDTLRAPRLKVGATFNWQPTEVFADVDVSYAQVGHLVDRPASWPGDNKTNLSGFAFRSLGEETPVPAGKRAEWLSFAATFAPDVYHWLFRIYRQMGREEDARNIMIALQDARRAELRKSFRTGSGRFESNIWNLLLRSWNRFLGWSVRYGYAIQRPLLFALALWVASIPFFWWAWSDDVMKAVAAGQGVQVSANQCTSAYPCFFPWSYSLELLLPVINLHQVGYWLPDASTGWLGRLLLGYTWVAVILGWLIGIVLIAGVGQLFSRRD